MYTVRIEHAISDFDTWKTAFDRASGLRAEGRVLRHCVARPIDDRRFVMVDLDFDTAETAESFVQALQEKVWNSPQAAPALVGVPQARIVENVERHEAS